MVVIYELMGTRYRGPAIGDSKDLRDLKGKGDPKVLKYVPPFLKLLSICKRTNRNSESLTLCVLQHKLDPYFA